MAPDADFAPESPARARGTLELVALLAGALLSGVALSLLLDEPERRFDELALGRQTRSHYATVGGVPIHCGSPVRAQPCLEGHAARGSRPVLLWLGNSQLHGINQMREGDRSAPEILHRVLDPEGLEVLAFSMPNANFQELLVLFLYVSEAIPVERLVVSLVFDDFREAGLREDVAAALDEPHVAATLRTIPAGAEILADGAQQAGGSLAALEGTVQQRTESFLTAWLDERWALWSLRPRARGRLFVRIHQLRNSVFGITPQSKRPVVPGNLRKNLAALEGLLREARRRGIVTLAYVAPLRNDVESPYVDSEYEAFKTQTEELIGAAGAVFANLESLVPGEYWGTKNATTIQADTELDFMHFQGRGHELLASAAHSLLDGARRAR